MNLSLALGLSGRQMRQRGAVTPPASSTAGEPIGLLIILTKAS